MNTDIETQMNQDREEFCSKHPGFKIMLDDVLFTSLFNWAWAAGARYISNTAQASLSDILKDMESHGNQVHKSNHGS
jgi:hypothetical protein